MFARRTNWSLTTNNLFLRLEALRKENKKIIDLTQSNPTRCGFEYPQNRILKTLAQSQNMIYEPSPMGLRESRQAIGDYYRKKGLTVDPEHIFLTASTSEAYSFLFRLLVNPREHIVVPQPSYPLFEYLARLNDVHVDTYPLVYERTWSIKLESLQRALRPDTKAIVVVNPNNPTGSFLKKKELFEINRLCLERKIVLICDEVFSDYRFSDDKEIVPSMAANREVLTFALSGISKIFALPQMKLGWGAVSGPPNDVYESLRRLEIILDTYLSVNTPVQNSLKEWFQYKEDIQRKIFKHLIKNREFVMENLFLSDVCQYLTCEGGWSMIVRLPEKYHEEEWALIFLEKDGVFVHPGYFFDFSEESYMVISLLVEPKMFQEGLKKIIRRVRKEIC